MLIISPSQFKEAFLKALPAKEAAMISCWTRPKTEFTATVRELLPEVATTLGLKIYNRDYYTLDAIFYEEKDMAHFPEHTTYAKYIAVALEHENRLNDTQVEMNKLQLFNVPLKVLITYSADEKEKEAFLSMYSSIIEGSDVFGDISTKRKQVVIFGSCDGSRTSWSFHLYRNGAFVAL